MSACVSSFCMLSRLLWPSSSSQLIVDLICWNFKLGQLDGLEGECVRWIVRKYAKIRQIENFALVFEFQHSVAEILNIGIWKCGKGNVQRIMLTCTQKCVLLKILILFLILSNLKLWTMAAWSLPKEMRKVICSYVRKIPSHWKFCFSS